MVELGTPQHMCLTPCESTSVPVHPFTLDQQLKNHFQEHQLGMEHPLKHVSRRDGIFWGVHIS